MVSDFLNHLIKYFYKKKIAFIVLAFSLVAIFLLGVSKININENIFSILPKGNSFSKFSKLIDQGDLTNQIVFSLTVNDDDTDSLEELTSEFSGLINKASNQYIEDVVIVRPDIDKKVYNYFYNEFPKFINDDYYELIESRISKDSIAQSLANSQRSLLSPGGFVFKEFILKDPIYLTTSFFNQLRSETSFSNINVEDGYVYSESKEELLITAKTTFDLSDNKKNVELYNILNSFKSEWNSTYPNNELDYFGTFQISAENGIQVKKDTFLTLIITLIVILMILFIFYRKVSIPLYFMFPILFGGLFSLGMIGFFRDEVSGISIATGAVVFGIIMDFSFHFFTHLQHSKSITETIKEISVPLLTGAFTTIMAFVALLFTNSSVLQDFGLFAALSIAGAGIFTLTGLPIILKLFKFNYKKFSGKSRTFEISIADKFQKPLMGLIILLTIVFFYFSFDIQFDGNLENLSMHSEELKEKERELVGINPETEKKVYLFSEGNSYESASIINYKLYNKIQELQLDSKVVSSFSTAKFIVPDSIVEYRKKRWETFWGAKSESLFIEFDNASETLGFNPKAFSGFKDWISSSSNANLEDQNELLNELGLSDFINEQDSQTTFITTIVVNKKLLPYVQKEIDKVKGVSSFNKSEVATELLSIVKTDFNFILLVSSLLVFISLLIIYGRIEMALFTFIPMVISWIWILGIASIFDMKFNFINIVIATFIFGLGDDFSIFVTDGLLHRYKYKKNTLGSYNTAIVLSAVTTMVGTGVLFFAEHPAINSVSIISVLGILCILLISIVVQPFLFKLFIQNRVDKQKTPISLVAFLFSVFEFAWFVLGCIVTYIILVFLILLPLPKKNKRAMLNKILRVFTWTVMYSALHVGKKVVDRNKLDISKPSIIIANHTSFLDILMLLMLNPKIIIMVKGWVYNSILFGPIVRYAGYIYVGDNPMEDLKIIQQRIDDGYSLAIFPEGSRSENDQIKRFKKGAFFLAQELKLDITPVLIHGVSYVLPKSEYFVRNGFINMKILPRIKADDLSWGDTFGKRTKSIGKHFKAEYLKFKDEEEGGKGLFSRVFSNYVYKGPVLEWYVRIKWKLEYKNFETYNNLLKGKSNIIDIGCGYGYLSYFLHYKDSKRNILGVDYDQEKIEIAKNGFDKTDKLKFEQVDITTYSFEKVDAIILNDVLHYFSKEKQLDLLEKCAISLNEGGIILIRDGITDLTEKHQKTLYSERLSTQLFSFNKKEEKFHFFSSNDIRVFAEKHKLSYKMEEHSDKTSNVLFTLKKNNSDEIL